MKNTFKYFLGFSIALVFLNKFIIIKNPLFSMGFFIFYKSIVVYPFFIPLIISSIWILITNTKKDNDKVITICFLLLSFYNIYFLASLVVFKALEAIEEKEHFLKIINQILIIQIAIGFYQILNYKSIGLVKIGETMIDQNIKGLSFITFQSKQILRAYGTMAHPNILGGFLAIFTNKFLKFANIISFSVNANLAQINFRKFNFFQIIPLITVLLIKTPLSNPNTYTERVLELTHKSYTPLHNVYLELGNTNIILAIVFFTLITQIYKKNKTVGISLFILSSFDHFLISHPQAIMLIGLSSLLIETNSRK